MSARTAQRRRAVAARDLACLRALERKVAWLSAWTIHHANHLRPARDGLKVGGHQASSASVVTLLTALYFRILRPEDRVAVKPHASPVYHAIQYLLGRQSRAHLEAFRGFGGAQSYPSRTKDADDVDFSTGSVGLGGAMALFASLVQDYILDHRFASGGRPGRMVTVFGDAELDEGNVYEALLEGAKSGLRNCWWVIDYNRQSLDAVTADRSFVRIGALFESMGWRVVTLKYGTLLQAAAKGPGGKALIEWIDRCPNDLYSAFTFKGGAAWRERLLRDLGGDRGVRALLDKHDDEALHELMTNLAGHDLEAVIEAFEAADPETPTCFLAYTIKGHGLPLAGHKDNHAGLMNPEQMEGYRAAMEVGEGEEWDRFAGLGVAPARLERFLASVPFAAGGRARRLDAPRIEVPKRLPPPAPRSTSTQEAFGRMLRELGRGDSEFARRILTTSPDVTVSTSLGGWVNQRQIYRRTRREDVFQQEEVVSPQRWTMSPKGQHIELGIAENNLFLLLAAAGLAHSLFGARLIPIGTIYDTFIARGLDALNYAAYQDARFLLVATPSGITLAPEGGAHQSVNTPLIGTGQPGLTALEPAYVDELEAMLRWAFGHLQADDGGSVYLRLSTRPLDQPERAWGPGLEAATVAGGYWMRPPAEGADVAIAYCGVVAPEAREAFEAVLEDVPGAGLLAVTSADRLHAGWRSAQAERRRGADAEAHVERLLAPLAPSARLVTVIDGHPSGLSWLGAVRGQRTVPLGVDAFGQSGDIPSLYRAYGLDADAILDASAEALAGR